MYTLEISQRQNFDKLVCRLQHNTEYYRVGTRLQSATEKGPDYRALQSRGPTIEHYRVWARLHSTTEDRPNYRVLQSTGPTTEHYRVAALLQSTTEYGLYYGALQSTLTAGYLGAFDSFTGEFLGAVSRNLPPPLVLSGAFTLDRTGNPSNYLAVVASTNTTNEGDAALLQILNPGDPNHQEKLSPGNLGEIWFPDRKLGQVGLIWPNSANMPRGSGISWFHKKIQVPEQHDYLNFRASHPRNTQQRIKPTFFEIDFFSSVARTSRKFPGWIQSTGHRGFNPPSDLSRGIYANATSPQVPFIVSVWSYFCSFDHWSRPWTSGITPFLSDTSSALTFKFGTTLWGARERLSYTPFLATNMLNTVNQNNQKATESGECSANVWDTGGNLRVRRKEMNLRGKTRSDFPKVWANLALFPKEVFPDDVPFVSLVVGLTDCTTATFTNSPQAFTILAASDDSPHGALPLPGTTRTTFNGGYGNFMTLCGEPMAFLVRSALGRNVLAPLWSQHPLFFVQDLTRNFLATTADPDRYAYLNNAVVQEVLCLRMTWENRFSSPHLSVREPNRFKDFYEGGGFSPDYLNTSTRGTLGDTSVAVRRHLPILLWLKRCRRRQRKEVQEYGNVVTTPYPMLFLDVPAAIIPSTNDSADNSDSRSITKARRQYLRNELRAAQEEIGHIQNSEQRRRASGTGSRASDHGMVIREMAAHIRQLEAELELPWARGFSDEPPPGYSEGEA
ncbi:hypothetical protein B0H16DRAFT_1476724 [Mycena metata]|uniref:Uncharacterized protein n=1 Tax=Mycena metata TaxID=1033252 RepID=A0AAD7HC10_9AGAR|nr:hypothetical protein B0H16DRAFT_1476724 [Mycena metata]